MNNSLIVVGMSGGLDSATLVARALSEGFSVLPLNFKYGQKHLVETVCQKKLHKHFRDQFGDKIYDTIEIDLTSINNSMYETYKKLRDEKIIEDKTNGLDFYTPSRNLVFAAFAAQFGEIVALSKGIKKVGIGLGIHKHLEYRNYWDITVSFAERLHALLSLNDVVEMFVYSPYVTQDKSEIVKDAIALGVPINRTWTCYNPAIQYDAASSLYKISPCKVCDACIEREKAGQKAGITDINDYSIEVEKGELANLQ